MNASSAATSAFVNPMIIESDLLGQVTVEADELITFADGLLGFPSCQTFVLISSARDGMYWLQSTEHPALAFVLVDPFRVCPGFAVDLGPADLSDLEADAASGIAILTIVTLASPERGGCTANLQGPLAFNLHRKRAKQVAIANSDFGVRWAIDLEAL